MTGSWSTIDHNPALRVDVYTIMAFDAGGWK